MRQLDEGMKRLDSYCAFSSMHTDMNLPACPLYTCVATLLRHCCQICYKSVSHLSWTRCILFFPRRSFADVSHLHRTLASISLLHYVNQPYFLRVTPHWHLTFPKQGFLKFPFFMNSYRRGWRNTTLAQQPCSRCCI